MSVWVTGISTAVSAGASIYGASQAGKAGNPPGAVDIFKNDKKGTNLVGRQSTGLLDYYGNNIPGFLALQDRFGPKLMGQMFGQTGQFLGGVNGQPGFQDMQLAAAQDSNRAIGQIRGEELGLMTGQTGLTRGLMDSLSPEQAAAVQSSAQEAERARASAQGVNPQEQRGYEQQARQGFQESGRLGGNMGIVGEAMGRESVLSNKRDEAAQAAQRSYSQAGEFYTNPGLQALRSAPLSYGTGQTDLRTALTMAPQAAGGFDFNMPLNLAQQQAGAQNQSNQAGYQAALGQAEANSKMWTSLGSSAGNLVQQYSDYKKQNPYSASDYANAPKAKPVYGY